MEGLARLTSAVPVIAVWPIRLTGAVLLTVSMPVIDGWRIAVWAGLALVLAAGGGPLVLDTVEGSGCGAPLGRGVSAAEAWGAAALGATIWALGGGLEIAAGKL